MELIGFKGTSKGAFHVLIDVQYFPALCAFVFGSIAQSKNNAVVTGVHSKGTRSSIRQVHSLFRAARIGYGRNLHIACNICCGRGVTNCPRKSSLARIVNSRQFNAGGIGRPAGNLYTCSAPLCRGFCFSRIKVGGYIEIINSHIQRDRIGRARRSPVCCSNQCTARKKLKLKNGKTAHRGGG